MLAQDRDDQGNMRDVYLDWARGDRERYESEIRRIDHRQGPYEAEIVPGCTPQWHAVRTFPNQEKIAAGHLIGRRFGVYVPEFDYDPTNVETFAMRRLLLPGYLLLFVWDVDRHVRRVRACTGVMDFLLEGTRIAIIPDDLINRIQACENSHRKPLTVMVEDIVCKKKYRPRRRMREVVVDQDDILGVHAYSAFDEERRAATIVAERQETVQGIRGAFHRAMGLPAQAA
jgi:transcription antitermination factor NusG